MADFVRIAGEVETPRIGEQFVKCEISKKASDLLCVAMARLMSEWTKVNDEDLPLADQLQKEVIKVWEKFRP